MMEKVYALVALLELMGALAIGLGIYFAIKPPMKFGMNSWKPAVGVAIGGFVMFVIGVGLEKEEIHRRAEALAAERQNQANNSPIGGKNGLERHCENLVIGYTDINDWGFVFSNYFYDKSGNTITYSVDVTVYMIADESRNGISNIFALTRQVGRCEIIMYKNPAGKWEQKGKGRFVENSRYEYQNTMLWKRDDGAYVSEDSKVVVPAGAEWRRLG